MKHVTHMRSLAVALALLAGCSGEVTNGGGDGSGSNDIPFEPVSPQVYVPKVKNLMTGLAATDAEVAAVVADPKALRDLIDQWMALPEFQARMLDFYRNAFQQNQVTLADLQANIGGGNANNITTINNSYRAQFERSLMDSFPMTAWQLVQEGRPFTETLTTHRFMLTTAMMSMMSYIDERATDDNNKTTDRLANRQALPGFTLDPTTTATLAQTLTPGDPNYMIWKDPVTIPAGCATTPPVVYTNLATGDKGAANYRTLFQFLFGSAPYLPCYPMNTPAEPPVFTDADWSDWHMVTINPTAGNTSPVFWDILAHRSATAMDLHIPRIGFSGTLAFAANWGTNTSNEARVTANQALIVSIGQSIAGENAVTPFPVNSTDSAHATDPACQGCHSQLDPLKQFFRQSMTLSYHDQLDTTQPGAYFNIDGVSSQGAGIGDLMNILASHPRFGIAWTQKLQFWANSTPADENDPEVIRIANAFAASNYDFKTLVREVFSSPLVTFAAPTKTTREQGVVLSISRRDQYCTSLSNRLGVPDICGMTTAAPTQAQQQVAQRALLMPVDTYYRAFALPSLPTNPDLFFRQSTEGMCGLIATQLIDVKAPGTSRYVSTDPTTAIADFVATIMDVPPADPRSAQAVQILTDHFAAAKATMGVSATDALKSTFTTACLSPSSVIVGL